MQYTQYMDQGEHVRIQLPALSAAAGGPLYQQLVDAIHAQIREGRLTPGQALPSFRVLAEQLLVSVITVKRAYEELERAGIIYRKQGLGTFVAEAANEQSLRLRRVEAEALLRRATEMGLEAGVKPAEMKRLLAAILQEKGSDENA